MYPRELPFKTKLKLAIIAIALAQCQTPEPPITPQSEKLPLGFNSAEFALAEEEASEYANHIFGLTSPHLKKMGLINPVLSVSVEKSSPEQVQVDQIGAGNNILYFTKVKDHNGKQTIIIHNASVGNPASPRIVDVINWQKSTDNQDLFGVSEEGNVILEVDDAWKNGQPNPEATKKVMTVDSNSNETGLQEIHDINPDLPLTTFDIEFVTQGQIKIKNDLNPGSTFIPPTPDKLPPFQSVSLNTDEKEPSSTVNPSISSEPISQLSDYQEVVDSEDSLVKQFPNCKVYRDIKDVSNVALIGSEIKIFGSQVAGLTVLYTEKAWENIVGRLNPDLIAAREEELTQINDTGGLERLKKLKNIASLHAAGNFKLEDHPQAEEISRIGKTLIALHQQEITPGQVSSGQVDLGSVEPDKNLTAVIATSQDLSKIASCLNSEAQEELDYETISKTPSGGAVTISNLINPTGDSRNFLQIVSNDDLITISNRQFSKPDIDFYLSAFSYFTVSDIFKAITTNIRIKTGDERSFGTYLDQPIPSYNTPVLPGYQNLFKYYNPVYMEKFHDLGGFDPTLIIEINNVDSSSF